MTTSFICQASLHPVADNKNKSNMLKSEIVDRC